MEIQMTQLRPGKGLLAAALKASKEVLSASAGKEFEFGNAHYVLLRKGHVAPTKATYIFSFEEGELAQLFDLYGLADDHQCTVV